MDRPLFTYPELSFMHLALSTYKMQAIEQGNYDSLTARSLEGAMAKVKELLLKGKLSQGDEHGDNQSST